MPVPQDIQMENARYKFIENLSSGGQGRIELYENVDTKEKVAIKFLIEDNEDARKRFLRESKIMSKIQHPNLVRYIDSYQGKNDQGRDIMFIIMAYVPGTSLKDWLALHGKLELRQAIRIMQQLLAGLQALHDQGIIHRDIKPANIMLQYKSDTEAACLPEDTIAILVDLGIIGSTDFHTQITQSGDMLGTRKYWTRDYWEQPPAVDLRRPSTDIFSLGITFYEMLTQHYPFDGSFQHYIPAAGAVPSALEDVLKKMLAPLAERYQKVQEIQDDLVKIMADLEKPIMADPLEELLDKLGNLDDSDLQKIWPGEEQCTLAPKGLVPLYARVRSTMGSMTSTRQDQARKALLSYCLRYGNWEQASQYIDELNGKPNTLYSRYLKLVGQRISNGTIVPLHWYNQARKKIKTLVWGSVGKEPAYCCGKCKRKFALAQIQSNELLLFPDRDNQRFAMCCLQCLLDTTIESPDALLDGYRLIKIRIGTNALEHADVLGQYVVAVAQGKPPYFIHIVPNILKTLKPETLEKILARYHRGLQLAYQLRKAPWVIGTSKPNESSDDDNHYFWIDYHACQKLSDYKDKLSKLDLLMSSYVLLEILRSLELLESMQAFHRNLSPHQIKIDYQGGIRLSGFYLAKWDADTNDSDDYIDTLTLSMPSGIIIGNPYYMAPELIQSLGQGTHRSDMWSFGAIAYLLITGKPLFSVDIHQIRTERKQTLHEELKYTSIKEKFPSAGQTMVPLLNTISDLVDQCLKKDPSQRPSASQSLGKLLPAVQQCYEAQCQKKDQARK